MLEHSFISNTLFKEAGRRFVPDFRDCSFSGNLNHLWHRSTIPRGLEENNQMKFKHNHKEQQNKKSNKQTKRIAHQNTATAFLNVWHVESVAAFKKKEITNEQGIFSDFLLCFRVLSPCSVYDLRR